MYLNLKYLLFEIKWKWADFSIQEPREVYFFSSCIFNPYFQICFVDDDQRQGNFTFLKRTEDLLDAARSRLVYKRIAKKVDWQNTNVPNGPRKGGGLYNHTMYSIFNIHGIYVLINLLYHTCLYSLSRHR